MMLLTNTVLGVTLALTVQSDPAPAAGVPAAGPDNQSESEQGEARRRTLVYVSFPDGRTLHGRVRDVREEKVVLELPELGGTADVALEALTPASQFVVLSEHLGKSGVDARLTLAQHALDRGLYRQAAMQYDKALRLSPENPDKIRTSRDLALQKYETKQISAAKRWMDEGDYQRAQELLQSAIENSGDMDLSAAQTLLDEAKTKAIDQRARKRINTLTEEFEPAVRAYEFAVGQIDKARQNAGDLADAEDYLTSAVDASKRALQRVQKIQRRERRNVTTQGVEGTNKTKELQKLREEIETFERTARSTLLDAYIELGHHYIVAGDLLEAHDYAGLARSIDVEHPRVMNLQRAIAAATATDPRSRRGR